MSAVSLPTRTGTPWREAAALARRTFQATCARGWVWVLAIGLVIALVGLPQRLEIVQKLGWHPFLLVEAALPFLASAIMYLGWSLADAGSDAWRPRRVRVLYALFGAGALATIASLVVWTLGGGLELFARMATIWGEKAPRLGPLLIAAEYLNLLAVGGVIYAVAEVARQRSRTQRDFEDALRRRGALEHQVLESRLAAMQAQVEPRFLFDTLVDIEALYEQDPQRAADNLDRLISYLRAALPRLRESGSTIEAEIELVRAYLEVFTALHDGRPRLTVTLAADCRSGRFYPMLLLPLVQRAVRHPSGALPETIAVDVRREGAQTVISLRIALAGGCADDPELARVRERLAGLYGAAAVLDCAETADGTTELTLRIPANGAAAAR